MGGENHTQESPIHSWNLMGPAVVSASKSGAVLPRRREGAIVSGKVVIRIDEGQVYE